jgi:Gly-Xaa carboxypeptidase
MPKDWDEETPAGPPKTRKMSIYRNNAPLVLVALAFLALCFYLRPSNPLVPHWSLDSHPSLKCPQVAPLHPSKDSKELEAMQSYLESKAFRGIAIERLAGAVQIPTQSYDDMGDVGADPRWDLFYSFADYLAKTFPLAHAELTLEKVNTHGLLYTWAGSEAGLKPNLLMAHQDVVPVPDSTVKQWTHPPFSGHFDGKFVWGRGASDCKNQLIAILSAVEALVSAGFTPRRTLILSFGFDEEISGGEGAKYLSEFLLKRFGHHSIAAIVDEGAVNVESWGANFAIPGVVSCLQLAT